LDDGLRKVLSERLAVYAAIVAQQIRSDKKPRIGFEITRAATQNDLYVRINLHSPQSGARLDYGYAPAEFGYNDFWEFIQAARAIMAENGIPERRDKG